MLSYFKLFFEPDASKAESWVDRFVCRRNLNHLKKLGSVVSDHLVIICITEGGGPHLRCLTREDSRGHKYLLLDLVFA